MRDSFLVYIDFQGSLFKVGRLWDHYRNGRESISFEYDHDWLNNSYSFSLESI